MTNYGLFLGGERCPDGVEVLHKDDPIATFQYRTDRREPLRIEIEDLKNPVVITFINARKDADRIAFFSSFGLLYPPGPESGLTVVGHQMTCRNFLARAGGPDQVEALRSVNDSIEQMLHGVDLRPIFDLGGAGGAPRMLLKCRDLMQFMVMEIAMVATNGARFAECEHCGDAFLTGHLTWRRSHAKYCSDRCRLAALRARQRA